MLGKQIYVNTFTFLRFGDIAQLARAPALQAGGPGFESLCLHQISLVRFGANMLSAYHPHTPFGANMLSAYHPQILGKQIYVNTNCAFLRFGAIAQLVRARH